VLSTTVAAHDSCPAVLCQTRSSILILQAVQETPGSGSRRDSCPYPMTVSKLRIMEGGANGDDIEMPAAFDGGGLGAAAAATPAARRFGLQMSPPNAAARQVCLFCLLCQPML